MAFEVPQRATDFFAAYPNAQDIYSDEDGKLYTKSNEVKALRDAKQGLKMLYCINKSGTFSICYNPNYQYTLSYNFADLGEALYLILNGGPRIDMVDTLDRFGVEDTIRQALASVGAATVSSVETSADSADFTIVTVHQFTLAIESEESILYNFVKTKL